VPRYSIAIEVESIEQLQQLNEALTRAGLLPSLRHVDPIAPPAMVGASQCSGGHGVMRLIPGGVARSGPRQGQSYPAFWKCDVCGERRDAA
jgi:hypothetical protein